MPAAGSKLALSLNRARQMPKRGSRHGGRKPSRIATEVWHSRGRWRRKVQRRHAGRCAWELAARPCWPPGPTRCGCCPRAAADDNARRAKVLGVEDALEGFRVWPREILARHDLLYAQRALRADQVGIEARARMWGPWPRLLDERLALQADATLAVLRHHVQFIAKGGDLDFVTLGRPAWHVVDVWEHSPVDNRGATVKAHVPLLLRLKPGDCGRALQDLASWGRRARGSYRLRLHTLFTSSSPPMDEEGSDAIGVCERSFFL